jgi:hypothetical protein
MSRHPTLGHDRQLREQPLLCSLCDAAIPEDHVPLMIFGPDRGRDTLAWVYCEACEGQVFLTYVAAAGGERIGS